MTSDEMAGRLPLWGLPQPVRNISIVDHLAVELSFQFRLIGDRGVHKLNLVSFTAQPLVKFEQVKVAFGTSYTPICDHIWRQTDKRRDDPGCYGVLSERLGLSRRNKGGKSSRVALRLYVANKLDFSKKKPLPSSTAK